MAWLDCGPNRQDVLEFVRNSAISRIQDGLKKNEGMITDMARM